jgi:hypothetical protein
LIFPGPDFDPVFRRRLFRECSCFFPSFITTPFTTIITPFLDIIDVRSRDIVVRFSPSLWSNFSLRNACFSFVSFLKRLITLRLSPLKPERGGAVVGRVALHHFYVVFRKETKRSFVFEREKICAQKREMSSQLRERK